MTDSEPVVLKPNDPALSNYTEPEFKKDATSSDLPIYR